MEKHIFFKGLLTEHGWLSNTLITTENGIIKNIEANTSPVHDTEVVEGYALPGFQNAHSHAFQYAMAGLAELHEGTGIPDDFWSWRTAMYELALTISPEQLEAIATQLYTEMVRHGYTAVTEFHYLHHQPDGTPYDNLAEMGLRLVNAAKKAGLHITLVPMFYQKGGFGMEPSKNQARFISDTIEDYYNLLEATKKACQTYEHAICGIGIHSLRAVCAEDIIQLTEEYKGDTPFHLHIAEQLKEIDDCIAFYGKRPVQWLLDNVNLDNNFHLVHATHLDDAEVQGIASSGAHVVLCPSTEGNLGDGIFRLHDFKNLNGSWSIGTDSHIGLNPLEELRILDYGQRLTTHKRTSFYTQGYGDSGFNAINMMWKSGRKAMGLQSEAFFKIGEPLNAAVINATHPLIATSSTKHLSNTIVYTQDASNMLGTLFNGKWMVKDGKHIHKNTVEIDFVKTLLTLKSRL
ncbi:formimidoylglutamate deiminase [Neptunitalea lumnitzerae]|uniref:Formimidoylglutamate deiminase n=1 Tax=Neptunitalea lumnitzerae TaxID=2965509 RepID=A0ABQ5MIQ1_9FLAO|nr:formimidoylglutamate deiminase [Neptunitalea sp. Y10]GLB49258.1 formimidoylglutamate deiminase [Neptunitalea sp. Y10]